MGSGHVRARIASVPATKLPFPSIHKRAKLQLAEGGRRGAVAQHDERRRKTTRATRFRRAALFAERLVGTGKKVKGREIDVAPWFCAGTCASKAANHWQATAPRRAPGASPVWVKIFSFSPLRGIQKYDTIFASGKNVHSNFKGQKGEKNEKTNVCNGDRGYGRLRAG